MKSRQKITRVQLETGTSNDFSLFGIVSAEPDYRLSLSINKVLKISLKNDNPVVVTSQKKPGLLFSRFSDNSCRHEASYHLISNKSGKDFFISKLKKIDYLFQVCSADNESDASLIAAPLRSIDTITAVFLFNPDEIKDKNLQYLIP
jgi:hypothetical protein